jgi:MFS family permease
MSHQHPAIEALEEAGTQHHGVVAREQFSFYNYIIAASVAFGVAASGMMNGMISTTLAQPSFLEYFHFVTTSSTDTPLIGAISGIYFAGAIFGTVGTSYVADRWGRKTALAVAAIVSIVCNALVAGSVHIAMLLIFR